MAEAEVKMKFTLPWPPSVLSPNRREHWRVVAKAKKAYRQECGWQAIAQGGKAIASKSLHLTITFVPPARHMYDLDNLLARMKSGLDGLADILQVDDSRWTLTIRKADSVGGMVLIEVSA